MPIKKTVKKLKPLERMELRSSNRILSCLKYWRNEGELLLNPPYQRGDVWGLARRENLIRSILLGIPIPSLIINFREKCDSWTNKNDWRYAVIDGRQRITTILMFLDGELFVPGEWFGISRQPINFTELPLERQRHFGNQPISIMEGALPTLRDEKLVFELVNFGGVPIGEHDDLGE